MRKNVFTAPVLCRAQRSPREAKASFSKVTKNKQTNKNHLDEIQIRNQNIFNFPKLILLKNKGKILNFYPYQDRNLTTMKLKTFLTKRDKVWFQKLFKQSFFQSPDTAII